MACLRCKGERIIWLKDKFGRAVAKSCPVCNRNGLAIKKEMRDLEREHQKRGY
nr:MAG TPA: TRAP Tryptophan RNA-binding attenuator protein inhibitory protein [Caudoviricetes sp.]